MIVIIRGLSRFLNLCPTGFILGIGGFLGTVFFYFIRFRRQIIVNNLSQCFKDLSPQEIKYLALRNYQHYFCLILEGIQSLSWTGEDFRTRISSHGLEHLDAYCKNKKGGFLLTLHLGNWELGAQALASNGIPLAIVTKQSKQPFLQRLLDAFRLRNGLHVFFETKTAKDILRWIGGGGFTGFVLDQFMGPPIGLPVQFFGRTAGTTVSLALLTEKRDVPILIAYCNRDKAGRNHVTIEPVVFPHFSSEKELRLYEKTQFFNDIIEDLVKKNSSQWLWIHRRWKAYRGVPRWLKPEVVMAPLFLLALLSRCTSTGGTPTGISIPPDTAISVPSFEEHILDPQVSKLNEDMIAQRTESLTTVKSSRVKSKKNPQFSQGKGDNLEPKSTEKPSTSFYTIPIEKIPFDVGEKLEMELFWNVVPLSAGRAILEVRDGLDFQGRKTFHLWGNVLSSKIVDTIYHIDNTAESYVDRRGIIPYKFLLHMVETQQLKETKVNFDHPNNKAFYWSKRISKKWKDELQDRSDELVPQARDLFSSLYYIRTREYQLKKPETFFVYENGKNWEVELLPVANEPLVTHAGAFQCWKILVTVKLNNILRPTGDVYMWISDDSKKYLVKFDAKIKIGSLIGNLVDIRDK